jgi:3-hydroxyacyl-[acyl-carrier-protein] dehydratase
LPVQLLFDISQIDRSGVMADASEVARVNPQTGHMRHLDHVIWFNEAKTEVLGVKFVRHDEFWIPGHIPGRPIFPGVLQIEAGAQLACYLQRVKYPDLPFLGFIRCDETVFRGQVLPGDTLYLLAQDEVSSRKRFVCRVQGLVKDKIVFESKITGMAI